MGPHSPQYDPDHVTTEVILEQMRIDFEQYFHPELIARWRMEARADNGLNGPRHPFDGLAIAVRGEILAEVKKEEAKVHTENPASWWDHFKVQHFPASWLRRWPAKMKHEDIVVTFSRRFIFPDAYEMGGQYRTFAINDADPEVSRSMRVVVKRDR